MAKFNNGIPKWQRKFRKYLTAQDIIMGRKVVIEVNIGDGTKHVSIEKVKQ